MVQEHCTEYLQLGELEKEDLVDLHEDDTVLAPPQPTAAAGHEQGTKETHRTIAVDVEVSLKTINSNDMISLH